jgi:hypothetical protein
VTRRYLCGETRANDVTLPDHAVSVVPVLTTPDGARFMIRNALLLTMLAAPLAAQDAPRFQPSGRGTSVIEMMVPEGATVVPKIRLDYGQPHLRGRVLHTETLVPYGKVWRTGANATSTLETDLDLMLGKIHLTKGRYAMFTMPTAEGWQLILQKDVGQGADAYDAKNDIVRLPLRLRTMATPVEGLTMWLVPASTGMRGELRILWGTTELSIDWMAM